MTDQWGASEQTTGPTIWEISLTFPDLRIKFN